MNAVTLVTEVLLFALFLAATRTAVRTRDPLARDVALVFAAFVPVSVVGMIAQTLGKPPVVLSYLTIALLFAQPVLVLRVVAKLRDLPRWLLLVAGALFGLSMVPVLATAVGAPAAGALIAVGVFIVLEAVAAGYLALEGRRRQGSSRMRLALAALATGGYAIAFLLLSGGAALSSAASAGEIVLLLSTLGYVVAFLPPARLRRLWQANTALGYSQMLVALPPTEASAALWARFADTAQTVAGGEVVVVDRSPDRSIRVRATTSAAVPLDLRWLPDDGVAVAGDVRAESLRLRSELMARTGAKIATVVPLVSGATSDISFAVLARHVSLFGEDDLALLQALGSQTAIFVERGTVLAEQVAVTARLTETVEALRAASAAKSDFLASMSHELRTPLNAVIGFSELMRDEPAIDSQKRVPADWIEHIHRSGQHLLALINDVLDLAKVEAGRLEFTPEPVELAQAIGETLAGVRPLADRKHIVLEARIEALVIEVDRGRLRQVLYNLLSNAIKYTPEGGRVAVATHVQQDEVAIAVADTGVGIAPEDQQRIFEEFTQVGDPALRQAGTGLGLALTRRLVEAQGGRVGLESLIGQGSTFTVTLPRREASGQTTVRQAIDSAPSNGALGSHVLLIEDDPSAIRLLRTYLEDEGHVVRVSPDAESGLVEARRKRPAAIILDVLLPGIDGWDLLRMLKADEALRDIPVIIVTVVDEREIGLALGAVDYFLKPVKRDALLARLARYVVAPKLTQRPVRVLAIDDEPAALALVDAVLQPEGFTVTGARSGAAGLELASREPFDLVICDLLMPELDGFAVIASLKTQPRTRDIPILVLTSHQVTEADKARLNGQILGIVDKGAGGARGLREWLRRATSSTSPAEEEPAA